VLAGQVGLPMAVVYVKDAFEEAERFRSYLRSFGDVVEIPIRPDERFASLPVLRALEEGRIVAVQGDRDWNDRGVPMPFLGAMARFPVGPFLLARMSGATLLPAFVAYDREHRFELEIGDPIEVARTADREGDARAALEAWLVVLARAVRRWPNQWYTFYDFWPDVEEASPAAGAAPDPEPAGSAG